MKRTIKNLEQVVKHLDRSSGSLYNALQNLGEMGEFSEEIERLREIDVTAIDTLKYEIEVLIQKRREERKGEKA